MIEALVGLLILLVMLKVLFWVFVALFSPLLIVFGVLFSIALFGFFLFGGFFVLLLKLLLLPLFLLLLIPFSLCS